MLTKKTALVTGASSGIGMATAEVLAERGHDLVLMGRRIGRLQKLCDALSVRVTCFPLQCDFFDIESIEAALHCIPGELRDVDVLVNNAGNALGLDTAQEADWTD